MTSISALCRRSLPAALSIALTVCAHPARAAESPLAWRIADSDSQVILLGSVHMLRRSDYPLPELIDQAYRESDRLVMELDLDDLDPHTVQQLTMQLGLGANPDTLRKALGDQAFVKAAARLAELGLDITMLSQMEPWFAAMTVVNLQLLQLGYNPEGGVDTHLTRRAQADGKTVEGLETMAYQLGLFDTLSKRAQRYMFNESMEDLDEVRTSMDRMVDAWRKGDEAVLRQEMMSEFEHSPQLYKRLVIQRNRNWAAEIIDLLEGDEDVLLVVGALHLIGDDSVLGMLQKRRVEPRRYRLNEVEPAAGRAPG